MTWMSRRCGWPGPKTPTARRRSASRRNLRNAKELSRWLWRVSLSTRKIAQLGLYKKAITELLGFYGGLGAQGWERQD